MRPSVPATPQVVATSTSTMTLGWTAPLTDGGCPITGYSLFRDDGITGDPSVEINSPNDAQVRDKPTLRSHIVNFDPSDLGTKFTFHVRVYNREGETVGTAVSYLFSTTPEKPS